MNASQLDFDPRIVDILPPDREVLVCPPETPVFEAAGRMRSAGVSSIVVTDDDGPVGIWTEHDALALDLSSSSVFDLPVSSVMSSPVRSIPSSATRSAAACCRPSDLN